MRSHLPAFLHRGATEQQDPAGDVRALLNLEQQDLDRVVAVHGCLHPAVLALGEALAVGLERPFAGSAPSAVVSQNVRGQIDWPGTLRHRARAPGEVARYSVREPGTAFDVPENRAVVWLLDALGQSVDEAIAWGRRKAGTGWSQSIDRLQDQLAAARRVEWLRMIPAAKPTEVVLRSLRAGRRGFYAEQVPAAIEVVLRLRQPSPEVLARALSERYFRPEDDGTLFELAVALRLAAAFRDLSVDRVRRTRLMLGDGRASFARYRLEHGDEVVLAYQAWPDDVHSMRRRLVARQQVGRARDARPDLMIIRRGSKPDAVILELKASHDSKYLRNGLQELLAYLADRPDLWGPEPVGWLVAPGSEAFAKADPDASFPLWLVDADSVAAAAAARFAAA
ncbi:MAG TPA: hypothetical protein VG448_04575 [Solirubrobacterales bacterium]|nr:hypothetical protein [Solirubrobacterales bacterium]